MYAADSFSINVWFFAINADALTKLPLLTILSTCGTGNSLLLVILIVTGSFTSPVLVIWADNKIVETPFGAAYTTSSSPVKVVSTDLNALSGTNSSAISYINICFIFYP